MNPKLVPLLTMTTQIAVRLPDDLVDYIDGLVEGREVKSRADFVARAIRREQRHRLALADAEIYRRLGEDPELMAIVEYQSKHPLKLDD